VNLIEVFRSIRRFENAKIYWNRKNNMYTMKFEVAISVFFPYYTIFECKDQIEYTHNFTIHKQNYKEMLLYLQKIFEKLAFILNNHNNCY
jgi:hypothetical protein